MFNLLLKALGILLIFASCNTSNKADYQDNYNNRLIFSLLMTPTPDPVSKCKNMLTEASKCIPSATDKDTIVATIAKALEPQYGLASTTIAQNLSSDSEKYTTFIYTQSFTGTYQSFCDTDVKSSLFVNASEGFKDCIYSCQKSNWTLSIDTAQCSKKTTQNLITDSLGSGQNLCAIKCSRITNN